MNIRKIWTNSVLGAGMLASFIGCGAALGQTATTATAYPKMAPVEQYRMERDAEIALARSAAPVSISGDAEVWVMGTRGYEIAAKGKNGFVCAVLRSWTAGPDDADFWNPKLRGPICFNAPAARTYWPIMVKRTELVLAGVPKEKMLEEIQAGFAKKTFTEPEMGSMSYMMSPGQYLGDAGRRWHPHLMFFVPLTPEAAWGANADGSPIFAGQDAADHLTTFFIPVGKWSDGTEWVAESEAHK
ncbi:MAG TPA: hypothetical protein VGD60_14765 [Candidatus Acidoferrales bacterium]